jgi:DNA modification methylase
MHTESVVGSKRLSGMQLDSWPITRFVLYIRNPRKNDHVVNRMMASIEEFGFKVPILAKSTGEVIDGHLRLKAAEKLGMTEVPVIPCDDWTDAQCKAFRLLVNRSVTWADWDTELLSLELLDLKELNFDLALSGFDGGEIDALLLGDEPDAAEDVVPDLPGNAVTVPGDLWLLGPHRVLCADSCQENAASRLCGATRPNLMATDPPYGVSYDPSWRVEHDGGGRHALGKVANDDQVDWTAALRLFTGDVVYVWHAGVHAAEVAGSLHNIGFQIRAQIIWSKQHFVFGRGNYHWGHEPCWYAVRKGKRSNWRGDRTQSTVWEVKNLNPHGGNKDEKQTGHGTQKPVELMRRPILNHTERGDVVYDPFLGSGSTLIAAEQTERVCYGLDIDPRYCDVIVLRWQQQSGKKATLASDGRTFEVIAQERHDRAGAV